MFTLRDELEFLNCCVMSQKVRVHQLGKRFAPPFDTNLTVALAEVLLDLEQVNDSINDILATLDEDGPHAIDFPVAGPLEGPPQDCTGDEELL